MCLAPSQRKERGKRERKKRKKTGDKKRERKEEKRRRRREKLTTNPNNLKNPRLRQQPGINPDPTETKSLDDILIPRPGRDDQVGVDVVIPLGGCHVVGDGQDRLRGGALVYELQGEEGLVCRNGGPADYVVGIVVFLGEVPFCVCCWGGDL